MPTKNGLTLIENIVTIGILASLLPATFTCLRQIKQKSNTLVNTHYKQAERLYLESRLKLDFDTAKQINSWNETHIEIETAAEKLIIYDHHKQQLRRREKHKNKSRFRSIYLIPNHPLNRLKIAHTPPKLIEWYFDTNPSFNIVTSL